eukprot:5885945-Pleurochrysis_carterae.AAC.1
MSSISERLTEDIDPCRRRDYARIHRSFEDGPEDVYPQEVGYVFANQVSLISLLLASLLSAPKVPL